MMNKLSHPFMTLPELPEAGKPLLSTLMVEPLMPLTALQGIVASYAKIIDDLARKDRRVNSVLGKAIAKVLATVLARVDDRIGDKDYRVIQAAVRYFVVEDDGGGSDFASIDGLVDDARVVNAMLRWLGRDELMLDVGARPERPRTGIFGGAAADRR